MFFDIENGLTGGYTAGTLDFSLSDYDLETVELENPTKINLKQELFEPAMFSAIHALELSLKAALLTKTDEAWKTHNVGGQFGKYFREEIGDKICRKVNRIA